MLHQILHRFLGRSAHSHRQGGFMSRSQYQRGRRATFETLEPRNLLSITVDTLVDENDGIHVGGVSLRDAVEAASPGETIFFDPSLAGGTMRLEHGQIGIGKDVQIVGLGADQLTIDAQLQSRHFFITENAHVTMSGLALTGGRVSRYAGAIRNDGHLMLDSVLLTGNFADEYGGAIRSLGTLRIVDSTISNNWAVWGGAIAVVSNAENAFVMERSAVIDNLTDRSGALRISGSGEGSATIINSTFSGNLTQGAGGAIQLMTMSPTLTIINSTITDNHANLSGEVSTRAHGGGGIRPSGGTVLLHNSIVAGNTAGVATGNDLAGNIHQSSSHNFIGNYSSKNLSHGENGNQIGSVDAPLDPMLAPLGDYGGPTLTHEPLPGSPVIDAARNDLAVGLDGEPLFRDGRGYARRFDDPSTDNVGGRHTIVDIGAVEWRPRYVVVWQDFIAPTYAGGVIEPLVTVNNRAVDEAFATLSVAQNLHLLSSGGL